MSLTKEDLKAIEGLIAAQLAAQLEPIKKDIDEMKKDLRLLATLNQLDAIRSNPRLMGMYAGGEQPSKPKKTHAL